MFVDLTPEQHALRLKVRDYFQNLMTPELRAALRGLEGGALYRDTIRQMGRDGWLALGWPKEHGGQGYATGAQGGQQGKADHGVGVLCQSGAQRG